MTYSCLSKPRHKKAKGYESRHYPSSRPSVGVPQRRRSRLVCCLAFTNRPPPRRSWNRNEGARDTRRRFDESLFKDSVRFFPSPSHVSKVCHSVSIPFDSAGIANGLFFSHILAFSPGFMRPPVHEDTPKIYMSHGTRDNVLPIDRCARPLAREIKRMGYPLVYREFNGGHTVPTDLAQEALDYLLDYGTHRSREEGDQKGRVFWAGVCQRVFHTRCCTVFSLS